MDNQNDLQGDQKIYAKGSIVNSCENMFGYLVRGKLSFSALLPREKKG